MRDELQLCGLTGRDQQLPPGVQVKHGVNSNGKQLHYYLNYTASTKTFDYSYGASHDLLTGRELASGSRVSVGPWDLVIAEEK
jgi:beta-galactosidase